MGSSVILPQPGQPATGPDAGFTTAANPNVVTFNWQAVGPPSPLYIQRDDVLFVQTTTNRAADTLILNLRILITPAPAGGQPDQLPPDQPAPTGPSNQIITTQRIIQLPAPNINNTLQIPLTEGYLLSVTAQSGNATSRGVTFARVVLIRAGNSLFSSAYVLIGDYVTNFNVVGWPGARQIDPTESTGFSHSIQQANPAAGADWTFTAGTLQRLNVRSFSAQFVASATVATRNIEVIVDDGANVVWRTSAPAGVTAGQTVQLSATGSNQPTGIVTTDFTVLIPPGLILAPGWRVRTATANIQVGDQWSNIWFGVEEWLLNV